MKAQLKVNSPQARDLAYAFQPYTNARKAVCSKCGHQGATLQHPSWTNAITGYGPFPG